MPALQTPRGCGGGGFCCPLQLISPTGGLSPPYLTHLVPNKLARAFLVSAAPRLESPPPFWVESLTLLRKPFRSAQAGKVRAVLRATACLPNVTATHGARPRCLCGLCASLSSCWTPPACPPGTNALSTAQIRKRRREGVGLTQDTGAVERPRRSLNPF